MSSLKYLGLAPVGVRARGDNLLFTVVPSWSAGTHDGSGITWLVPTAGEGVNPSGLASWKKPRDLVIKSPPVWEGINGPFWEPI